jgi:hypothetical protein
MFDPSSLIGKEIRALDDEDYGHRILIYYPDTQQYVVETIYWNDGRIVNPDYLGSVIGKDDLYSKYDVNSARG